MNETKLYDFEVEAIREYYFYNNPTKELEDYYTWFKSATEGELYAILASLKGSVIDSRDLQEAYDTAWGKF